MKPIIYIFLLIIALIVGISAGYVMRTPESEATDTGKVSQEKHEVWTCSMHPQVKQDKPGKCPICFMDLILLKAGKSSASGNNTELQLSPEAQKIAEIQTAEVERRSISVEVDMVGEVEYNESLIAHIPARMPGRIDRLFANYTGIPVRKGDHLAEYYSPDLLIAQRELLLAAKNLKDSDGSVKGYGMPPEALLNTVKKKLQLWGLTEGNIKKIIETGKVADHIVLYAPIGGIVIQKNALEGKYFNTGERLFTIADLSSVWVQLDAYESDISKLAYGQKVEFTTEAYKEKKFAGRIAFIDPMLDMKTRTIKVRVNAENPEGELKPGMFVRAIVKSAISSTGKVIGDQSLAGKWISPMHPEIIKDHPGQCDICGMDLVPTESLGLVKKTSDEKPLVIPASAPLITGKRAIVYVEKKPGLFEGKEVKLGLKGGNYYIVLGGLEEGEKVVVNGNFKIDSALQILAKPSMMSEGEEKPEVRSQKLEKKQTLCPIMGGKINKDFYTDVKGKRIYVCCPGCIPEINKDPDKIIKQMEAKGIVLEDAP